MVLSGNTVALWSIIGAVGLSTAGILLPAEAALPPAQNATQAAEKKPFVMQLGRLQLRMVPTEPARVVAAAPVGMGMNNLTRAFVVVATIALACYLITFMNSVFEGHANQVKALEAKLEAAEKEAGRAEALATELEELNASVADRETGMMRANVCATPGQIVVRRGPSLDPHSDPAPCLAAGHDATSPSRGA